MSPDPQEQTAAMASFLRVEEGSHAPTNHDAPVSKVLEQVGALAILPQVACKILEETESEDIAVRQLEQTISVDPALSARVLAQANSAYFGLPKRVSSIREAVMFLGFKGVRQMVMTIGLFDLFLGKNDQDSLRRRKWWRHSLNTAVFCKAVAAKVENIDIDQAFTCGLLHILGKTFLDRFSVESYTKVQCVVEQGAPDILAERAVFGCDHIVVTKTAARNWGFPEVLIEGLDYFNPCHEHTPEHALRGCTAMGTKVVNLLEMGVASAAIGAEQLPGWILDAMNLPDNEVRAVVAAGSEAISLASDMKL
ncbi:MAG: HDOD domain-containing protein [Armatimonadetes bacterium]|nr:HDOD domain-containing protein [Armatimonadota bacterium]